MFSTLAVIREKTPWNSKDLDYWGHEKFMSCSGGVRPWRGWRDAFEVYQRGSQPAVSDKWLSFDCLLALDKVTGLIPAVCNASKAKDIPASRVLTTPCCFSEEGFRPDTQDNNRRYSTSYHILVFLWNNNCDYQKFPGRVSRRCWRVFSKLLGRLQGDFFSSGVSSLRPQQDRHRNTYSQLGSENSNKDSVFPLIMKWGCYGLNACATPPPGTHSLKT